MILPSAENDHYKPFQKDHYKPRMSLTVQAVYNFGSWQKVQEMIVKQTFTPVANFGHQALHLLALEL